MKRRRAERLSALADEIRRVLRPLLPPGTRCAHLGHPSHSNPGDSAIWLGERRVLRELGVTVAYACDAHAYRAPALARALPEGPILLAGGGNLGDLWREPQQLRERVLADFPRRAVIQLPQSLYFERQPSLERMQKLCAEHRHLTLLLREEASLAFARRHLAARSELCPDMSFALGLLARPARATQPVLWLARADRERRGAPAPVPCGGVTPLDWIEPTAHEPPPSARLRLLLAGSRALGRLLRESDACARSGWRLALPLHARLAHARVVRGSGVLARGRVVVTDRLHGHLLALLLGIPHVAYESGYGKLRGVHARWTAGCEGVHWAESPEQAIELALALAQEPACS